MAIENGLEAPIFQPQDQFVHERGRILARIGDEDLELLCCASIGHTVAQRDLNEGRGLTRHTLWGVVTDRLADTASKSHTMRSARMLPVAASVSRSNPSAPSRR